MLSCEEKALEPLLFALYLDRFVDYNQLLLLMGSGASESTTVR